MKKTSLYEYMIERFINKCAKLKLLKTVDNSKRKLNHKGVKYNRKVQHNKKGGKR